MKFLRLPSGTVINLDNVTSMRQVEGEFNSGVIALDVNFAGEDHVHLRGDDMAALTEWFNANMDATEGYYTAECSNNDAEAFTEPYNERDVDLYRHAEQMNRNPEMLSE